jgi:hypothetical protein
MVLALVSRSEAFNNARIKANRLEVPASNLLDRGAACGRAGHRTISAILKFEPSMGDLEVAASYLRGEGSEPDRLGHQLTGKLARIYDILSADALYTNDER